MEENQSTTKIRRLAADSGSTPIADLKVGRESSVIEEDASPEVARENIVKDLMRIFDGLLGCTSKRTGASLTYLKAGKTRPENVAQKKPDSGAQGKLEQQIYRRIKGLVEVNSPNTGFALDVLYNNGTYFYNKANVPLSFGTFLTSLVSYLEGHNCLNTCPDEMVKMKELLNRG